MVVMACVVFLPSPTETTFAMKNMLFGKSMHVKKWRGR
jgi:hypothetical protein